MINDVLNDLKNTIKTYTEVVVESENLELRDILQNLRSYLENFQYNLLKISESKGYNIPIQIVETEEIEKMMWELNAEF